MENKTNQVYKIRVYKETVRLENGVSFDTFITKMRLPIYGDESKEKFTKWVKVRFAKEVKNTPDANSYILVKGENLYAPYDYRVQEMKPISETEKEWKIVEPVLDKKTPKREDGSPNFIYTADEGYKLRYPYIFVKKIENVIPIERKMPDKDAFVDDEKPETAETADTLDDIPF